MLLGKCLSTFVDSGDSAPCAGDRGHAVVSSRRQGVTELCPTHGSAPQLASAAGVLGLSYLPSLAGERLATAPTSDPREMGPRAGLVWQRVSIWGVKPNPVIQFARNSRVTWNQLCRGCSTRWSWRGRGWRPTPAGGARRARTKACCTACRPPRAWRASLVQPRHLSGRSLPQHALGRQHAGPCPACPARPRAFACDSGCALGGAASEQPRSSLRSVSLSPGQQGVSVHLPRSPSLLTHSSPCLSTLARSAFTGAWL